MSNKVCSREGCTKPSRSLGMCASHYGVQHREAMRSGRRPRPEQLSGREARVLSWLRRMPVPAPLRMVRQALAENDSHRVPLVTVKLTADYLVARGLAQYSQTSPGAERYYEATEAGRAFPQARIDEALS